MNEFSCWEKLSDSSCQFVLGSSLSLMMLLLHVLNVGDDGNNSADKSGNCL